MNNEQIISLLKAEIIYFQDEEEEEYVTSTDDELYCDFQIENWEIVRIETFGENVLLVTIK